MPVALASTPGALVDQKKTVVERTLNTITFPAAESPTATPKKRKLLSDEAVAAARQAALDALLAARRVTDKVAFDPVLQSPRQEPWQLAAAQNQCCGACCHVAGRSQRMLLKGQCGKPMQPWQCIVGDACQQPYPSCFT